MTEKSTFWQSNLTDQFRNSEIHTWLRQAWRNKQKWNEEMYKWSPKPRVISFSPRLELQKKNIEIGLVSVDAIDNSSN